MKLIKSKNMICENGAKRGKLMTNHSFNNSPRGEQLSTNIVHRALGLGRALCTVNYRSAIRALLFLLALMTTGEVWADTGDNHYYVKVNVSVGSGQGTVYVGSSGNQSQTQDATNSSGGNLTFTLGATAANGYQIVEPVWSGTPTPSKTSEGVYSVTIAAPSKEGSTTTKAYSATFTPISYGITYNNLQGATNPNNPSTYTIEDAVTFSAPSNRTGYNFSGWNPNSIAKGSTGAKSTSATWTPIPYSITYKDVYGVTHNNPDSYTIESNTITFAAPTTTRTGYTFKAWSPVSITKGSTGNKEITATWTANKYDIHIDYNGGKKGEATEYNNPKGLETDKTSYRDLSWAVPSREGYTFTGFYDGDTKIYGADGIAIPGTSYWNSSSQYIGAKNMSLVAKWSINSWSLTLNNLDGATYVSGTKAGTYDYGTSLTQAVYSKTGYSFAWNESWPATMPDSAVTRTAQWTANTYTAHFKGNGGTPDNQDVTQTYDANYILPSSNPTREHYDFAGWYLNSVNISSSTTVKITAATDILAQWKPKFYFQATAAVGTAGAGADGGSAYVSFTGAGETSKTTDNTTTIGNISDTQGSTTVYYNAIPKDGYAFVAWYTSAGCEDGTHYSDNATYSGTLTNTSVGTTVPISLYAKFAKLNYFYATAAVQASPAEAEVGKIAITTKPGETPSYEDGDKTAISKTNSDQATTATYLQIYPTLYAQNITNGGYTFAGWYLEPGCTGDPISTELTYTTTEANKTGIETTTTTPHDNADKTYYAKFNPKTLTITFEKNGGATSGSAQIVYKTNTLINQTNLPVTRAGWTLQGYYTSTSNDEMVVNAAGQLVESTSLTDANGMWIAKSNQTLYAKWKAADNTITLDKNGGTQNGNASVMSGKTQMTITSAPIRAGYSVVGYLDAAAGTQVADANGLLNTDWAGGDGTLYTKWGANTYAITLNPDVDGMANGSAKVQSDATAVTDFSGVAARTGYTLLGYYTPEGNLLLTTEGALQPSVSGYTDANGKWINYQNTTLTAHWKATEYTINLNHNSGSSSTNQLTGIKYGQTMPTGVEMPTRKGYEFLGYYDEETGGKQYFTAAMASANTWDKDVSTATTLWAHWQAKQYTVTFNGNGGTITGDTKIAQTYDNNYVLPDNDNVSRTGYTFAGWWTAKEGGTKIESTTTVTITGDQDLYAHWTANTYTITFDKGDGSGGSDNETATYDAALPKIDVPDGYYDWGSYYFVGYFDASSAGNQYYDKDGNGIRSWDKTSNTTLYAQYSKASTFTKNFTLYKNGGTSDGQASITGWSLAGAYAYDYTFTPVSMPLRTGYSVDYWVTENLSTKVAGSDCVFESKIGEYTGQISNTALRIIVGDEDNRWRDKKDGIFAHWKANTYTVTLDNQEATTSGTSSITATYDAAMPTSGVTMPLRTGYTFGGYYSEKNGGGTQYYTSTGASARTWNIDATDATLYAKWTPNTTAITFSKGAGASGGSDGVTATYDATMPAATAPTLTGSDFLGYFDAATDGNQYYTSGMASVGTWNKDVATCTLYAHWQAKTYTITLDKKGGTGGTGEVQTTYGGNLPSATQPSKTGYTFAGYYATDGDKTSTQYYNASMAAQTTWGYADNGIIYAIWDANQYDITLAHNDGTGTTETAYKATYGQQMPTGHDAPTRTGYQFTGYYDGTEDDAIKYYNTDMTSAHLMDKSAATTLYAHWSANNYTVQYASGDEAATGNTTDQLFVYDVEQAVRANGYTLVYTITYMNLGEKYTEGTAPKDFLYWQNGSNIYQTDGTKYKNLATEGTYLLTAQWSEKTAAVNLAADPTRIGYTFLGWWTKDEGEEGAEKVNSPAQFTGATTLYAHWQANTYKLTFDACGGNPTPADVNVEYNTIYQYPAGYVEPTNGEKVFEGWFTGATGGTQIEFGTMTCLTPNDQKLYAQWSDPMDVNLANPDGTANGSASITTKAIALTIEEEPSKLGYHVEGYYTQSTLSTKVALAQVDGKAALVKGVTDWVDNEKGRWIAGPDKTIYIKWQPNTYDVIFHGNNNTGGDTETQKLTYDTKQNLTANGFERKYTVTFDGNQGSSPEAQVATYTFIHWTTDEAGEGTQYTNQQEVLNLTSEVEGTYDLYAQWQSAAITLPSSTRSGYTFAGWKNEAGTIVAAGASYTPEKAETLTAQWTANKYNLILHCNGGKVGEDSIVSKPSTGDNALTTGLSSFNSLDTWGVPSRDGYTFAGYYDGNTKIYNETDGKAIADTKYWDANRKYQYDGDMELWAHWNANTYTVTYDAQGGTVSPSSNTVTYDGTYGTLPTPVYYGYHFDGWYSDATEGTPVISSTVVKKAENHSIYAHWSKMTISDADAQSVSFTARTEKKSATLTYAVQGTADNTSNEDFTISITNHGWSYAETDWNYSNGYVTITLSFTATENTTKRGDNIDTVTVATKSGNSAKGKVTASVHMTPDYNASQIADSYNVDDDAIDLDALWTSSSDGVKTYSVKSFAATGSTVGGQTPYINNNKLYFSQSGNLVIALNQAAGTSSDAGTEQTKSITINKLTPTFTWGKDALTTNEKIAEYFSTNNTQSAITPTSSGTAALIAGPSDYTLGVRASGIAGNATLKVKQAENYKWAEYEETKNVTTTKASNHVAFAYTKEMYEDGTITNSIRSSWNDDGWVQVGSGTWASSHTGYVLVAIEGIPDKLVLNHRVSDDGNNQNPTWRVAQGTTTTGWDDSSWGEEIWTDDRKSGDFTETNTEIQLKPGIKYIQFHYSGYRKGEIPFYVTELQYYRRQNDETSTLNFGANLKDQIPAVQSFVIEHCNAGYETGIKAPAHYQISFKDNAEYADSLTYSSYSDTDPLSGGDKMGTITIYVKYLADDAGTDGNGATHNGNVVVSNDLRGKINIPVTGTTQGILHTTIVNTLPNTTIPSGSVIANPFRVIKDDNDTIVGAVVTYTSEKPDVLYVNEDYSFTTQCGGDVKLYANYTPTGSDASKYKSAKDTFVIHVEKCEQHIVWNQKFYYEINEGESIADVTLNASVLEEKGGAITYSLPNNDIASLTSNNILQFTGKNGSVILTAEAAATDSFALAKETKKIVVRYPNDVCDAILLDTISDKTLLQAGSDIIFEINGPARLLEFKAENDDNSFFTTKQGDLKVQYSVNVSGNEWNYFSPQPEIEFEEGDYNCPMDPATKRIRFVNEGNSTSRYSNIKVTRAIYINPSITSFNGINGEGENFIVSTDTAFEFTIDYSSVPHLTISHKENSGVYVTHDFGSTLTTCDDYGTIHVELSVDTRKVKSAGYKDTIVISDATGLTTSIPVRINVITNGTCYIYNDDSKWTDILAWSNDTGVVLGYIPDSTYTIEIHNNLLIDTIATAYRLVVKTGGSVTIAPTGGLSIYAGGITGLNSDASLLRIQSADSAQGFFRMSPDAASAMPKATVEYASRGSLSTGANKDATWQYFGVPFQTKHTVDYITWLYQWDETSTWKDLKAETQPVTLKPWQGYAITQYGEPVYEWQGQLLKGNKTITLSYTEDGLKGQNIIANSYTSPIDVKNFTEDDFTPALMEGTFYIFNSGSWNEWKQYMDSGKLSKLRGTTPGTFREIPILGAKYLDGAVDQTLIAPMQGICVKAKENGASITFNYEKHVWNATVAENDKSQMNDPIRIPSRDLNDIEDMEEDPNALAQRVRLAAYGENSGADYMYLMENAMWSSDYDNGYDAIRMSGTDGLAGIYATESFGQATIAATNEVDSMFIGFQSGEDTSYEMFITSLIGQPMYLLDTKTNQKVLMDQDKSFTFTATPNTRDDFRFRIIKRSPEEYTGWEDYEAEEDARMWTARQVLYIADAPAQARVYIYGMSGQMIHSQAFSRNVAIPIHQLPEGCYMARVGKTIYKFVK